MKLPPWLLALLTLLGCGPGETSKPAPAVKLPELVSGKEEDGFVDLTFALDVHVKNPDGSQIFRALALYQGKTVGFTAWLAPNWKESKEGPVPTWSGLVELRSSGPESDLFLTALGELYRTTEKPPSMGGATRAAGIALKGSPTHPEQGEVAIKLFFEAKDLYAEAFLNIDLPKRQIQLREKDPEYRNPLVRALAGSR